VCIYFWHIRLCMLIIDNQTILTGAFVSWALRLKNDTAQASARLVAVPSIPQPAAVEVNWAPKRTYSSKWPLHTVATAGTAAGQANVAALTDAEVADSKAVAAFADETVVRRQPHRQSRPPRPHGTAV